MLDDKMNHLFNLKIRGQDRRKICKYIFDNMDKFNVLPMSDKQISEATKTSWSKVYYTIIKLKENNLVKKQFRGIMINPDWRRNDDTDYEELKEMYNSFDKKEDRNEKDYFYY